MSNNLSVKQKFYKKGLFEIDNDLYHLYADISTACCMGELSRSKVGWILETIDDINTKVNDLSRL